MGGGGGKVMTDEIKDLAERIRNIMLSHGEPLKVSQISRTIEIPTEKVAAAMKILVESGRAQVGVKGFRAI